MELHARIKSDSLPESLKFYFMFTFTFISPYKQNDQMFQTKVHNSNSSL
jgi:hypothetical protein